MASPAGQPPPRPDIYSAVTQGAEGLLQPRLPARRGAQGSSSGCVARPELALWGMGPTGHLRAHQPSAPHT